MLAVLNDPRKGSNSKQYAISMLEQIELLRAQSELTALESRWAGLKNYRNYRTPFK